MLVIGTNVAFVDTDGHVTASANYLGALGRWAVGGLQKSGIVTRALMSVD
jgi:hypothetical protein